jgi:N-acyl-D-amino-acid deacylase
VRTPTGTSARSYHTIAESARATREEHVVRRAQRLTLHVRHGEVRESVCLAGRQHRDDVGLLERHGERDLALESLGVDARGQLAREELHHDLAVEADLVGEEDPRQTPERRWRKVRRGERASTQESTGECDRRGAWWRRPGRSHRYEQSLADARDLPYHSGAYDLAAASDHVVDQSPFARELDMNATLCVTRLKAIGVLSLASAIAVQPLRAQDLVAARVDSFVRAEMARQRVPGLSLAVVRNGQPVKVMGYGEANVEHNVPVTRETIFQSGSLGKQFTSALVMLLVQDGKLKLDDTIDRYFPEAPPAFTHITVRQLLNHTSGIPDYTDGTMNMRQDYTEQDLAKLAFGLKPEFPPGSRWNYSNTGYVLLGIIAGKVGGKFYGDQLADRVFKPLGMNTARIISEADIVPHRAAGYVWSNGKLENQSWVSPKLNTTADGSLYFSANDLLAWERAVRQGTLLSAESWRTVFEPVRLTSGRPYPYGMGWTIDTVGGQLVREHGGAWQGFKSYLARYTGSDMTVMVLANLGQADPAVFAHGVAAIYDSTLTPPPPRRIADNDPAMTQLARSVIVAAAGDRLTPAQFAYVRAGFFPAAPRAYAAALKGLGEPTQMVLLSRRQVGDDVVSRYEVAFGDAWFNASVAVAPDKKLAQFSIAQSRTTLIHDATIIDGRGGPAWRGDVRIAGDRIVAVAHGDLARTASDNIVDAHGLALAPGFIDTHSHHDVGLFDHRDALAMVSQGVTTIVVGQDGGGAGLRALFARVDSQPVAVNVASYAGHGSIRRTVLGASFKRTATPSEVAKMQALVRIEMDAGALGLSTGLEYDPGIYSSREEVQALAKVAADAGGRYISHIRSEDRDFWSALDELIAIGRMNRMPVQVSHIKLGMRDLWGQGSRLIRVLDSARASGVQVTADVYPYTYWQSNLGVFYPKRNFADSAETAFILEHLTPADEIIFNSVPAHRDYTGKTLAQIAQLRGTSSARAMMALLAEPGGSGDGIVAKGMSDADVETLIRWPYANVCSDGQSMGLHPRGFGSFAKVIGPFVRDKKLFALEEAVRKMTSLAAANVGIKDRGAIEPGFFADLVLFDPVTVSDRASFQAPQATAVGVSTVWVNGRVAFDHGAASADFPGRALRRQ